VSSGSRTRPPCWPGRRFPSSSSSARKTSRWTGRRTVSRCSALQRVELTSPSCSPTTPTTSSNMSQGRATSWRRPRPCPGTTRGYLLGPGRRNRHHGLANRPRVVTERTLPTAARPERICAQPRSLAATATRTLTALEALGGMRYPAERGDALAHGVARRPATSRRRRVSAPLLRHRVSGGYRSRP
jgi:hypothetical protein